MSLIQCNNCGGKVSNTVKNCIHCGATIINQSNLEKIKEELSDALVENEECKEVVEETLIPFSRLDVKKQTQLEVEFLKSDRRARNYRRKGIEMKKYASLSLWLLLVCRLLMIGQDYIISKFFDGKVHNQQFIAISEICVIGIGIIWIATVVLGFYCAISYRRTKKRHMYNKKFQKWLRETKKIDYVPNLLDEKDKQIFDQIDLNTMNL